VTFKKHITESFVVRSESRVKTSMFIVSRFPQRLGGSRITDRMLLPSRIRLMKCGNFDIQSVTSQADAGNARPTHQILMLDTRTRGIFFYRKPDGLQVELTNASRLKHNTSHGGSWKVVQCPVYKFFLPMQVQSTYSEDMAARYRLNLIA